MAKFDVFVGRESELTLIDEWAERWWTPHWIVVGGAGGIGKTFLLNKVMEKYQDRDDFVVVYYDFSEQPPGMLREAVHTAESVGWGHFPQFRSKITDLASGEYDVADVRLPYLERQALLTLVKELGDFLSDKRLIRLTDTLDVDVLGSFEGQEFYQYLTMVPNVLGISAGREVQVILPELQKSLGEEQVTYIELESFDSVESDEFFVEVDCGGFIPDDMRAKLHFLTAGRPILLNLAAEWLFRNVPLPDIVELSLAELESLSPDDLRDLRQRFEFELVDRVRQLKSPLDRAILYMAHISRRVDVDILATLLNLSQLEAEDLLSQLAELSFVRYNSLTGSCMLHDEMRNLVNRYAWPYVDATGDMRRKLTLRVIEEYYAPRIQALAEQNKPSLESEGREPIHPTEISHTEWEQWRLEAECLHYHSKISEEQGFEYFDAHFREAETNNHMMRMQFLLSEMEVAGHADIRDTVELRRAESLRLRGKLPEARDICERALERETTSLANQVSAHITLGWIEAPTEPAQAIAHFETALRIARDLGQTQTIGVLHNNLGQVYQSKNQLELSAHHYKQAIAHSRQVSNQNLFASATNNLAYVYRLRGNLSQADAMCRVAMVQRKRLGLERGLAYSYLTKAEIDRDKGDLESAERYTKMALRSFDKLREVRGQVMAYNSLANIHRHLDQYERAEMYLKQAVSLAKQINDEPLLASVLDVYGREQRDHAVHLQEFNGAGKQERVMALFRNAQEHLEQGLELAKRYGDQWLMTRSQLELALVYFFSRLRPLEDIYALLEQVWESAEQLGYTLLQGYVEEIRGEIALLRYQDYVTAARHFGQAAQLVGRFTGREPARFFDRISDYLLDVRLSSEDAATLAQGILDVISTSELEESLEPLRTLCQQILALQDM